MPLSFLFVVYHQAPNQMVNQSIWRNQEWAREKCIKTIFYRMHVFGSATLCVNLKTLNHWCKRGKLKSKGCFLLKGKFSYLTHCCCLQSLYDVSSVSPAIAKMQKRRLGNVDNFPDPYLPIMWKSPSNLFARIAARSPLTVRPSQKQTTALHY